MDFGQDELVVQPLDFLQQTLDQRERVAVLLRLDLPVRRPYRSLADCVLTPCMRAGRGMTHRPASFVSRFWRRKTRFSSRAQLMLDLTVSIWICCEPGMAENESRSVRTGPVGEVARDQLQ